MVGGAFTFIKPGSSAAIVYRNDAVIATLDSKGGRYGYVSLRKLNERQTKTPLVSSLIPVVAPVAGGQVFTKIVSLPPMPQKEVMPTILLTEKDSIPFPVDEAHIGAIVLNSDNTQASHLGMRVLVCAMPKSEMQRLRADLSRYGLLLSGVTPYVMAISSLIKSEEIDGTVIVVNAESGRTGIHILKDGVPLFTREIPIGAKSENDDSSKNNSPLSVISQEIDRSIKSFSGSTPGGIIEAGFLTGFSPYLYEVGEKAEKATGINFHPLAPNVEFLCDDAIFSATAIAPLIGAAIDGGSSLNLLPSFSKRFFWLRKVSRTRNQGCGHFTFHAHRNFFFPILQRRLKQKNRYTRI